MRPSPAALCAQCQKLWILLPQRNLQRLFAPSQMVLRSMPRGRSLRNRSRAVSLRARLPSKDPQSVVRTCNQQVDEQGLCSLKKWSFNLPMICARARAAEYVPTRDPATCGLKADQCGIFAGATASAIDFNIRPRSLLVERTTVVSFSKAARMTSRLRRKE